MPGHSELIHIYIANIQISIININTLLPQFLG